MPELPEVENVVQVLREELIGAKFGRVRVLRRSVFHGDSRPASSLLAGRSVLDVGRRGKRIEFRLSGGLTMFVHLGMTGQLSITETSAPVPKHTHLIGNLAGTDMQLRFRDVRRFGGIWLMDGQRSSRGRSVPAAGPDAMETSLAEFRRLLSRDRQIKALLMDQRVLAGLGNIYCDESLFRSRVHPLRKSSTLSSREVRHLHGSIRRVLGEAIRAGGSTIRDYLGPRNRWGTFQTRHRVYGRAGEPCVRCGAELERIIAAGRGTTFCPTCQPGVYGSA